MLGKLIKFIILTRFSKPLLVVMAFLLIYYISLGSFSATGISPVIQYIGAGIITFMLVLMTLAGGMVVMKSDRDFLFTLPLDKRELALSLYIAQFVASGIMIFVVFGFFISAMVIGSGVSFFLLPIDLIAFALSVTSLSIISNVLETKLRVLLGVLLALWALSALLGFPFSPAAIFAGNVIYGSAAMLVLTLSTTVIAFRELENVELGTMRSLIRATSSEVKKNKTFGGMSPIRAIFSLNFYNFEFSGRVGGGMSGTSRYQSGSVKIKLILPVTCALAAVYGYLALISSSTDNFGITFLLPFFITYFAFFVAQGGMTNERAWLAFTSMEPSTYFRNVTTAKALSFAAIISPFAIANIILAFLGAGGAIAPIIPLIITIPCSTVILFYWSSRVYPVQIKEEAPMMPAQFNLRQMTTIVPTIIIMIAVIISALFLLAGAIVAAVTMGLTLYLLYNRHAWDTLVEKLTENGFI